MVVTLLLLFPLIVFLLYINGTKLSVLGTPGHNMFLGLTSFGDPVEGLGQGMILVSIAAGGPFGRSVVYVLEHTDRGSLGLIVNKSLLTREGTADNSDFVTDVRYGGPVEVSAPLAIHNMVDVPGAERLIRNENIFLNFNYTGPPARVSEDHVVLFEGASSWGAHQLEGEVRRGAWAWIRRENVCANDVLEIDTQKLRGTWERLMVSPNLQVFRG